MDVAKGGQRRTSLRLWDASFRPGEWLFAWFSRLDQSRLPIFWLIGFFVVQTVPATIIRASNLEEGRIVAMARGAMEDGHWLTPFVYGERFAERPVLLSWIAALSGELTGGVTLWSLRIPHLCFFLAGALLIYGLLRTATGKSAAVFGALCWICMPVVAPKFINAEPDIVLSVLLFAAFCIWWTGTVGKHMTLWRWLAIGILMSLAGLTKGPQPVAFLTLGVGAYILLKQRDQIPAFIAVNLFAGLLIGGWYVMVYQPNDIELWRLHSRLSSTKTALETVGDHLDFVKSLAIEFLPGTILLGPAIVMALRARDTRHDLLLAAILYSVTCTLVLVFWPGGVAARYAMPATMTLAVICGLMFDRWRSSHPRVIVSALVVTCLIFSGLFIRGWMVMPFWPDKFQGSRIAGEAISHAIAGTPGPLYVVGDTAEPNMLVYVRRPIRAVALDTLATLTTPAVAVLLPEEALALAQKNPDLRLIDRTEPLSQKTRYRVVEIVQPVASTLVGQALP